MPDSYPFPIYSGLLEPRHYKSIGSALWLFLWCVSSTTKEIEKDGVTWGIVLGNKPIKSDELAMQFGVEEKTVRRWIKLLEDHGYIRVTRAPYGLIFTVRNSKKYQKRVDENVLSPPERSDINVRSDDREWTGMSDLTDINVRSNKDITGDITVKDSDCPSENARDEDDSNSTGRRDATTDPQGEISLFKQIENRYIERRGRGLNLTGEDIAIIHELLKDGIPPDSILAGIDQAFEHHKPRYKGDRIMTFAYCDPVIREHHYRETAKGGRPHVESNRRDDGHGRASPASGRDSTGTAERPSYYDQFDGLITSL